mmetsp:Transcript_44746/g.52438  ORF Transcript_44746/g.52438 Transcript_44746/m.52438 type:complete len:141 (-) Transcript_44746:302-724(-)|eukprot:CAMPEP_0194360952 /NCGR_PEP_ID=MMETSP0174-20130528/8409_1 /TAXON_ID=216777 /ORGANISM="Proboscia alata, Strain PI-D3" /LENGTH=140 /DNA_ID=CAMNT_0039132793 /DNA_START=147 /DNA_END=569 /DNA_ORIENTATION=-
MTISQRYIFLILLQVLLFLSSSDIYIISASEVDDSNIDTQEDAEQISIEEDIPATPEPEIEVDTTASDAAQKTEEIIKDIKEEKDELVSESTAYVKSLSERGKELVESINTKNSKKIVTGVLGVWGAAWGVGKAVAVSKK